MKGKQEGRFTVSGPGVDRPYPEGGPALSAAITYASRATGEATFYVRHPDGDLYGRVERAEAGSLQVYRIGGAR